MDDILDLDTRRDIYTLIKKNPGLHLSKIAEMLHMRTSHVEYHLLYLEKHEIIQSEKEKGFKRFYIKGQIGVKDKKYLFILRQKTILQIIWYLLQHDHVQHKQILDHLDVSASTLSYHLNKLVKKEIIQVIRFGEEKGYHIQDKAFLIDLLIRYKPYNLFEEFSDVWSDFSV